MNNNVHYKQQDELKSSLDSMEFPNQCPSCINSSPSCPGTNGNNQSSAFNDNFMHESFYEQNMSSPTGLSTPTGAKRDLRWSAEKTPF